MATSTREWAFIIWTGAFLVWALMDAKVRQALLQLVRAFFAPVLLASFLAAAVWIALCVQALANLQLWTVANLKSTMLWAAGAIVFAQIDFMKLDDHDSYFVRAVRDSFSAALVVSFVADSYTFPLAVELALLPAVAVLAGVQAMASRDRTQAQVHTLATGLLTAAGVCCIAYGVYRAATDFEHFATWDNLRDFFVPIALSLMFLPFLFALSVKVAYDQIGSVLKWSVKDPTLRRMALVRGAWAFLIDREGLRRWRRQLGLFPLDSSKDVRASIAGVRASRRRQDNYAPITLEQGWCPEAARAFLPDAGISVGDYHQIDNEEWWASSPYRELNPGAFPSDNVAYYIAGTSVVAKRLRIKLNVNQRANGEVSDATFRELCIALIRKALPGWITEDWRELCARDAFEVRGPDYRVTLELEDFTTAKTGYCRTLTIIHRSWIAREA